MIKNQNLCFLCAESLHYIELNFMGGGGGGGGGEFSTSKQQSRLFADSAQ